MLSPCGRWMSWSRVPNIRVAAACFRKLFWISSLECRISGGFVWMRIKIASGEGTAPHERGERGESVVGPEGGRELRLAEREDARDREV